ncbi:hypothetical protein D3C72_2502810 [compost metagenome]
MPGCHHASRTNSRVSLRALSARNVHICSPLSPSGIAGTLIQPSFCKPSTVTRKVRGYSL